MFKKLKHGIMYIVAFSTIKDYVALYIYEGEVRVYVFGYNKIHRTTLWYIAYKFKKKDALGSALRKTGLGRLLINRIKN
jgi:hypothetical protein